MILPIVITLVTEKDRHNDPACTAVDLTTPRIASKYLTIRREWILLNADNFATIVSEHTPLNNVNLDTRVDVARGNITPRSTMKETLPSHLKFELPTQNSNNVRRETTIATVLFDEGADRSFVTKRFAQAIDAKVHSSEVLNLKSFSNPRTGFKTIPCTTLQLHQRNGNRTPIDLLYVEEISDNLTNNVNTDIKQLNYLRKLKLAHPISDETTMTIDILIGVDRYWDFVGNHVIRGHGPTAVSSCFGYLLSGPINTGKPRTKHVQAFHLTAIPSDDELLAKNVASFWELESIGIRDPINPPEKKTTDDEQFKQYTENCLSEENNRFIAKLPWKSSHYSLPTNFDIANKRTRHMIKKLPRDITQVYDKIISDQLKAGFIERVEQDDTTSGHYLPHRSVKRDSSSTPIRIVYDCSATSGIGQPSLNDCLERGPPLLNDLTAMLVRFRSNPVALASDIEKAFLQIRLADEDRKYTKFLWLSDINDLTSEFMTYQFTSVLFGARCSPFILKAAIKTLINNHPNIPAANDLQQNIYVDDVVTGSRDTNEAIKFYEDSTKLLSTHGFNLRSWSTNDQTTRDVIKQDSKANPNTTVNVLGVKWNTESDVIYLKPLNSPNINAMTTKREVVSFAASLYDPLGLLSPVHVRAKLFIQSLWKLNLHWDTPISDELNTNWTNIAHDLREVTNICVTQHYFADSADNKNNIEIHAFSDASSKAYGGAVYIKSGNQTSLVMSKTRVAPTNKNTLTLPRLELMAALTTTRLSKFVSNALSVKYNITRRVLWSDSQIVLHWINSCGKPDLFTSNRITEINSFPQESRYVPTSSNPADLLTRGLKCEELRNSTLWWTGPSWLKNRALWPVCELFGADTISDITVNHLLTGDTHEPIIAE
ncbi:uncharacterized protein LOC102804955 [Saccoglossus kowalevskii]|uniref:Uncharacterized protein LOC102804955 n=1 Tax=Saccoglossus kowalevskii TaxID=10224 RepID=A0ABM0LYT5_SACKO|nr:PREDICTED: uncharacterized protein LOC102804955 [Saccoglossus kowalevskii]